MRVSRVSKRYLLQELGFARTSRGIKPPATSVAFEVFRFLVGNQELQVLEISFAVVAPWSRQELFHVRLLSLLLSHLDLWEKNRASWQQVELTKKKMHVF